MPTPSPWKFFSVEELACRHCGEMKMNHDFMEKIVKLRLHYGFAMLINSAYRCPDYDAAVGSSNKPGGGPHTLGHALDIRVYGARALLLLKKAQELGLFTGFGLDQRIGLAMEKRYVHIDDLMESEAGGSPRPHVWTY